jgi:hypothetical protein
VFIVASVIDRAACLTYGDLSYGGGWITSIAGLALLLPGLAVGRPQAA